MRPAPLFRWVAEPMSLLKRRRGSSMRHSSALSIRRVVGYVPACSCTAVDWAFMNSLSNIEDRAHRLLKSLVESYIDDGQPVASRRLASLPGINVSSATVRNIMADLESRGLVMSPHTSAGKVPTQAGLRLFVDSLLSVEPLTAEAVAMFRNQLNPDRSPQELIESASRLLAHVTQLAGLVTLPRRELPSLRHVEFLPLPGQRVLVILVVNEKDVQNRVIHTERDYTESELVQAANYINREFAGQSLALVRAALLDSLQSDKDHLDRMMQAALDLAGKAFAADEPPDNDFVMTGETNLIAFSAESDMAAIRQLFETFQRKRDVLHLLDRCLTSPGVQLFIGAESGQQVFGEISVVTAAYHIDGRVAGVLGVIGPTRMAYQRVIPLVDMTAHLLGSALNPAY